MRELTELEENLTVQAEVKLYFKTDEQKQRIMSRIMRGLHLSICGSDGDGMYSAELLKDTIKIL